MKKILTGACGFACVLWVIFAGGIAAKSSETGASIIVEVSELRSTQGMLMVNLFSGEGAGFPANEDKALRMARVKLEAKQGRAAFEGLAPGTYAVAACHDENNNGVCDTNLLGMPTEGVGTSNGAVGRFGPPRYADAKLELAGANKTVPISIDY